MQRAVLVINYHNIDIYLKVKASSGLVVEIWGTNLRLSDYNTDGISVRGRIASIELHGNEDEVE